MKIKKIVTTILCTALVANSLAGCGNDSGNGNVTTSNSEDNTEELKMSANGEFPIVDEKMTFTIMAPQKAFILDIATNEFTKWYEEKTNIHIEWELVPDEAIKEKVNLALASGEYPDAFLACGITEADQVRYGGQGVFLPLNNLIDNYSKDFKTAIDGVDILPAAITAPDGNIYALPQINQCYHCFYPAKMYINQEWLKNVGMEYPQTTEEFYQVLKAFKEQDANGNGDPNDEIPMMGADKGWYTGAYDALLNSFVYNDALSRYALIDGKVTFVGNTEEFREGLRYIYKLVSEGLLDPVSFTQQPDQAVIIGGDPESIKVGVAPGATFQSILGDPAKDPLERYKQYVALSPLEGPNGVRNTVTEESGVYGGAFVITNKCKNPEILFRWADGGYNAEVTLQSQIGPEGTGWNKPTEGVIGINGKAALYSKITHTGDTVQNYHMENVMLANRTMDFRLGEAVDPSDILNVNTGEPRRYEDTKKYYEPYRCDMALPPLMYTQEEADERAMLQTAIDDYIKENIVAFMVGNKDLDKDWDSYVKEFDNLNLSRAMEIIQTAYDRQYK